MGARVSARRSASSRSSGSNWGVSAGSGRIAASVFAAALVLAASAHAQTWNLNADGTWGTAGNWTPTTVPNAIGAAVTLGSVITADRTITLDASTTIGSLTFAGTKAYTIASSAPGNTLTFDVASGTATLSNPTTAVPIISGNVVLNDTLVVTSAIATGITGNVSGTGGLTNSGGTLYLTGTDTYSGITTISSGTVQVGLGHTSTPTPCAP